MPVNGKLDDKQVRSSQTEGVSGGSSLEEKIKHGDLPYKKESEKKKSVQSIEEKEMNEKVGSDEKLQDAGLPSTAGSSKAKSSPLPGQVPPPPTPPKDDNDKKQEGKEIKKIKKKKVNKKVIAGVVGLLLLVGGGAVAVWQYSNFRGDIRQRASLHPCNPSGARCGPYEKPCCEGLSCSSISGGGFCEAAPTSTPVPACNPSGARCGPYEKPCCEGLSCSSDSGGGFCEEGPGNTPTPTPPGGSGTCEVVKIYAMIDDKWQEVPVDEVGEHVEVGNGIRLAVEGNMAGVSRGRFSINGGSFINTSSQNGQGEFYIEYTIPQGGEFTIVGEVIYE